MFTELLDSRGATTGARAEMNMGSSRDNHTPILGGGYKLMQTSGSRGWLMVTDIPYRRYDVYVGWGGRMPYKETTEWPITVWLGDQSRHLRRDDSGWYGVFVESTSEATDDATLDANYAVFRTQTGETIELAIEGDGRSGLSFIQIVEVP